MSDLLHMGGYAAYVWPAFGITALVLVGLLLASLRHLRAREADLALLQQERPRRRPASGAPEALSEPMRSQP